MTISVNGRALHIRVLPFTPGGGGAFRLWVRAAEVDDADEAVAPEALERQLDSSHAILKNVHLKMRWPRVTLRLAGAPCPV